MKGFRKCWLCTVKPNYVALMKEGIKTVEVRTRVPRDMRKGDGLYIMEKGTRTLALIARIEGITTTDWKEINTKIPRSLFCRTGMSFYDMAYYLKGRPQLNFIEITSVWVPSDKERKFFTPEYYGYRCMPQGILPIPGKWKP